MAVSQFHLQCPACGASAGVYTSRPVSRMTRELFLFCRDADCQSTFRALVEVLNEVVPSMLTQDDERRQWTEGTMRVRHPKPSEEVEALLRKGVAKSSMQAYAILRRRAQREGLQGSAPRVAAPRSTSAAESEPPQQDQAPAASGSNRNSTSQFNDPKRGPAGPVDNEALATAGGTRSL